jgi:hypothetical protein
MANPRNPDLYQVLSVLWQVACDIKVLHKVSKSFQMLRENYILISESLESGDYVLKIKVFPTIGGRLIL